MGKTILLKWYSLATFPYFHERSIFQSNSSVASIMSDEQQLSNDAQNKNYGADSIQVLEGLEAVRKDQPCTLAILV